MATEKSTGIDAEQMKEILATVIAEIKKPAPPTPEQEAAKKQEIEMRRQQAELVLAEQKNRELIQETCTHVRRDGTTTAVYVQDGNYMICQQCQKIIRPDVEPALFNRMLQLATPAVF